MNTAKYQIVCAAILGFGQLCIMAGFDAESFILESVIHSIHERNPSLISQYAGYYGQAICYAGYMITCLFSSSLIIMTNAKTVLFTSAVCFAMFPIGFFFTNQYYFFVSSAITGIGFSLFYQGQGSYMASHSTRNTIEFNDSVSWSIGCFCLIVGSCIIGTITTFTAAEIPVQDVLMNSTLAKVERRYSDTEITLLFGMFALFSILGSIFFAFLPSEDVDGCIESGTMHGTPFDEFKATCATLIEPQMLKLFPLFALCGANISFFLSILPTAFQFNMNNSGMIYLPAIYSFGVGIGEISSIFFGLLPSEDVEGCIESGTKRGTPFDEFKATCATLIEPQMLKLFPLFALCGANMSFFLSILPTSLQFNMNNTEMVYLLAIYSFGIGIGEILTGFFISAMSKKIKDFALQPTLSIAVVCLCTYCGLVLASTPYDAPMRPTHEQPLLFQQSQLFILILAVIIGIVDNCINTVRGVICTLSMPSRRTQAHAISKLIQAATSCALFFLSPLLNIYYYTIGLPILSLITVFLFFPVSRRTQRMERKITTENLSKASARV
ncbi:unnamed protein product [Caenorhabditis bovis]|uniref:Uncharacterized protein n=1 Tax=Caenorhabditis bovis TaxID=2654633 RepID=A0A8S1E9Z0_9PELO|nr:unnamed protein product [Caenorhabditis bovis]